MKEVLEVMAKALVDNPEKVSVTETESKDESGVTNVTLELRVAEDDMGKVIGRQGRIAKAIRSVVKAAAGKENKRAVVEIL